MTVPKHSLFGILYGMDFHSISEAGYEYIGTESRASYHCWIYDSGRFWKKRGPLDFLVEPILRLVPCGGERGLDSISTCIYIFTYPYLRII